MESRFLVLQMNYNDTETSGVFSVDGQNVFDREQALDIIAVEIEKWVDIFIEYLEITESEFWEMVRQGEIGYDENFIFASPQGLGVEFKMIELHAEVE